MYIVDEQQVKTIYDNVKDLTANSFEGKTIIDPTLDVGDKIIVDEKPIIYQGELDFRGRFIAEITSKIEIKQKQETTVKEPSQKVINRRVQSRIDEAEGKITQLVEENSENSNKLSKVEQTVDGIKETVSSVETKVEEVEGKAEGAQNTANTANTNATQAQNTANEAKETAEITTEKVTEVEKTVDGISQSVEKVETTLKEDYSTTEEMKTAIEQESGKITSSVTEKIENIQVGGTNLIQNSAPYNLDGYEITSNENIELILQDEETAPFGKCLRLRTLKALTDSQGIYVIPTLKTLEIGKEYSFSLWLKATANTKVTVGCLNGGKTVFDVTTEWKKFVYTFKTVELTSESNRFEINIPSGTVLGRQVFAHSIKLEEGNKTTAWSPAPEDDVKGFEFGTKIEQNSKYVQYAWNNQSQNIKLEQEDGNSTMGFYDGDNKFAEMGVNSKNSERYISFAVPVNYGQNIQDGMAWGMQTPDGKFWPILYINNFRMANKESGEFSGDLVLDGADLVLGGINSGIISDMIKIHGDVILGMCFTDIDTGQHLMNITQEGINILDVIKFYKNTAGSRSLRIGNGNNYCLLTDDGYIHGNELDLVAMSVDKEGKITGNLDFYNLPKYQGNSFVYGEGHEYHLEWNGQLQFYVDITNVGTLSDKRLKKEIKDIDSDLLKAVEEIEIKQFKVANRNGLISFGILAQDLIEIFQKYNKNPFEYEIVYKTKFKKDDDTIYYAINYEQFLILKQKATDEKIKQLSKEKDELILKLTKRIEKLEGGSK